MRRPSAGGVPPDKPAFLKDVVALPLIELLAVLEAHSVGTPGMTLGLAYLTAPRLRKYLRAARQCHPAK